MRRRPETRCRQRRGAALVEMAIVLPIFLLVCFGIIEFGRALMVGTKLVLLDEPFQGLAPALAKRYGEALVRLREAEPGLAVLISESNPDLLKPMVDSAFLIERGEVRPTVL